MITFLAVFFSVFGVRRVTSGNITEFHYVRDLNISFLKYKKIELYQGSKYTFPEIELFFLRKKRNFFSAGILGKIIKNFEV